MRLALPITDVACVLRAPPVTVLPGVGAHVVGIAAAGGEPLLVVRLDDWLSDPPPPPLGDLYCLLVLAGPAPRMAIAVDRVCAVDDLDAADADAVAAAPGAALVASTGRWRGEPVAVLSAAAVQRAVCGGSAGAVDEVGHGLG